MTLPRQSGCSLLCHVLFSVYGSLAFWAPVSNIKFLYHMRHTQSQTQRQEKTFNKEVFMYKGTILYYDKLERQIDISFSFEDNCTKNKCLKISNITFQPENRSTFSLFVSQPDQTRPNLFDSLSSFSFLFFLVLFYSSCYFFVLSCSETDWDKLKSDIDFVHVPTPLFMLILCKSHIRRWIMKVLDYDVTAWVLVEQSSISPHNQLWLSSPPPSACWVQENV